MAKTATFNLRIDPVVKRNAENVLSQYGITATDAVSMLLHKVIMDGGLPFDLRQTRYNAETEKAMKAGKQLAEDMAAGKVRGYDNIEDMFKDLNADV